MDNGSNNNILMLAMENSTDSYCNCEKNTRLGKADNLRILCLPHIINLSRKAFFKSLEETDDTSIDDKISNNVVFNLIQKLHFIVKNCVSMLSKEKNSFDIIILSIVKI